MQFRLYAVFRLHAGTKAVDLDLPAGTTVRQAVAALLERHPGLLAYVLDEAGSLSAHAKIFVNRRDVQALEKGMDTPLPADAVLDLFSAVGGG
jgi:molybdopterin converting factor small subunit